MNCFHFGKSWAPYLAYPLLAACATPTPPEPRIITQEVRVPYDDPACAREALARLRTPPDYPDSDEARARAADVFEGSKLLLAGRLLRIAREAALWGAIEACAEGGG